jgi:ABC-type multidrug transport system ATPase subunit
MLDKPATGRIVSIDGAMIRIAGTETVIGPYDLDLKRGEVTSIVGPSGSGKTTLVRAIVQRSRPAAGAITIDARPDEVAYVPQNVSDRLNQVASALRHLRDVSAGLTREEAAAQLERLRIPADAMGRSVGTFSAGQQQRLVLLTVLLRRPKLIVLDEPTSALDVKMRHELAVTLRRLAQDDGIAVLLATHHLPFVSVVSDRIWRLSRADAEAAE